MDLSTPAGLESLARDVAELLGAHRTVQDGTPGRVRTIFTDGRTLELVPNRPRTRITMSDAEITRRAEVNRSTCSATAISKQKPRPYAPISPAKSAAGRCRRPQPANKPC